MLVAYGDCSTTVDAQCAADVATGVATVAGPVAGVLKAANKIGKAGTEAIKLTSDFMAWSWSLANGIITLVQ